MKIIKAIIFFIPLVLLACKITFAQSKKKATSNTSNPGIYTIKEVELKDDLYKMASDHFAGREAGTLDELRVSTWFADLARKAGLKPAGDDSTYFQFFNMWRNRISPASNIKIGDTNLKLWEDVLVAQTAPAIVSAPVIFINTPTKAELDKTDLKGKAVAVIVSPEGINLNVSLPERRYLGYVARKYADLQNRGAAAIIFIADEMAEKSWNQVVPALSRGTYDIDGGPNAIVTGKPPILWLHPKAVGLVQSPGATLHATLNVETFLYPSVNIIGKIEGTDPVLKNEYVLFSGHQDHDGVRQPYGTDSIYNGADDNASVSVAILAIARAFKQNPAKRSALFVWHGAEERGLLGSKWYSAHPTVNKESIVAVLNGDMIGRNTPDSAALLGAQPPHRNSNTLVSMALAANNEGPKFKLDTLWDKVEHVEGWYFRSDHLPYARAGIPSIFFTTLLHSDYHTPMDDAEHIDYKKLTRVTEWMYRTGWKVANSNQRPDVIPGFKLER
jgi:hypothetical protein